jgi:surface protein
MQGGPSKRTKKLSQHDGCPFWEANRAILNSRTAVASGRLIFSHIIYICIPRILIKPFKNMDAEQKKYKQRLLRLRYCSATNKEANMNTDGKMRPSPTSPLLMLGCCCSRSLIPVELVFIIRKYYCRSDPLNNHSFAKALQDWCDSYDKESYILEFGFIGDWNTSQVTAMGPSFSESFNDDISEWDVGNVTDMCDMFLMAKSFNQSLEKWNVSKVKNMQGMFLGASSFNQPLERWNVQNVTDMSGMFDGATHFNQPLGKWDVSNVTDMSQMFLFASSFNQPLEDLDVSNVTNMMRMFAHASQFNQPLGDWDVSNVSNMEGMFYKASHFNQSLEKWDRYDYRDDDDEDDTTGR